jgi:hypothetical protein
MSVDGDNIVIRHLQEFRAHMDARFDNMDRRFDEHDLRFVRLEARVSDVEGVSRKTLGEVVELVGRVGHVERGLDEVHKDVGDVRIGLDEVRKDVGEVQQRLGTVEDVVRVVAGRVERLETGLRVVERLDAVERKVAALGRRGRR